MDDISDEDQKEELEAGKPEDKAPEDAVVSSYMEQVCFVMGYCVCCSVPACGICPSGALTWLWKLLLQKFLTSRSIYIDFFL